MGNNQGKQVTKKDVLVKLSNTQRGYVESWYLALSDEESNCVSKRVFFEDVLKRFANMPAFIIDSLFECMDPDSTSCVSEDSFFYMAYLLINGNHEEKLELIYGMLQRIGKMTEVTVGSVIQLFNGVNMKSEEDDPWDEAKLLGALGVGPDASEEIISWDQFYVFGCNYPNCPIIYWINLFRKQVEQACELRQQLADDETTGNAKLSKQYYTTRRSLIYGQMRDMSISVLMEIYGILLRSTTQGFITKAQWLSEMAKFFSHELILR